jgi:hypothetical protein
MADEVAKKHRIYCNWCQQETNHELRGEHQFPAGVEIGEDDLWLYRFWVCSGCEHGTLLQSHWVWLDDLDDGVVQYFPKRTQGQLCAKPYAKLKPKLSKLYEEAITCYNQEAFILCAAGLRALLEGICHDKRIKGKNLKAKIEGLKLFLPNKNIIRNLHHFRFMGNEAVHELSAPKPTELGLAIEVIEDLLNFFYELDYKASQLREMRRARKAKAKIVKKPADSLNHWADAAVVVPKPANDLSKDKID